MKAGTKGSSRIEPVVFHTFNTIFMLFVVTVTLYPFLQTLAVSFNDGSDTLTGGIYLWPRVWTLENYRAVFISGTIYHAAFISVSRTIISTVLGVFLTTMLAYALAQPIIFSAKDRPAVHPDHVFQCRADSELLPDQEYGPAA